MKVGVLTAGSDGGRSGIGQYTRELLLRFAGQHRAQLDVLVDADEAGTWLPGLDGVSSYPIPAWCHAPARSVLWAQTALPWVVGRRQHDVLFLPAANRRVPWYAGRPTVGTVHDLAAFHIAAKYDPARNFYIRHVLPALIRRLTHVITISEASKRDIVQFARVDPERVTVIPLAADLDRFTPAVKGRNLARTAVRYGLTHPYVLYVARIEHPAKNHVRLIEAFERLKEAGLPHELALVGPDRERANEVHARAAQSPYAAAIRFPGFVADADVADLYRGAACVAFPSLYEGFGLPVLEAMASGVPVACANVASLPEVAGDAAKVFDPYDYRDISSALNLLLTDKGAHAHYREAGLRRSALFSWDRTAACTWRVIDHVAGQARRAQVRWAREGDIRQ